jgi:hypothetical protein
MTKMPGQLWARSRYGFAEHDAVVAIEPAGRRDVVVLTTSTGTFLDEGYGSHNCAPPSLHPDGHRYEWLVPLVRDGRLGPIDWLPDGIQRLLDVRDAIHEDEQVDRPVYTLYNLSLQNGTWRLRTEVVPPPIDGLIRVVRDAVEGNRNATLHWAALTARDEGVTLDVATRDLGGAAIEAGLGPREVRTTIRSAYRRPRVTEQHG